MKFRVRYNLDKWAYNNYDTEFYNFRSLLEDMLGRTDLEELHKSVSYPELFTMKTEQSTIYHKEFYDKVRGSKFLEKYNHFIEHIIKPHEHIRTYRKIIHIYVHMIISINISK